ncbi:polycomb protein suz12-A isoform X2 [Ischnura elegans]|uniref:polycomb protein suz12-A isoform X2 n=1 Tax=Ischnura elegans TaxID=197161 RepID=UPI001ED866E2|nr:polycomb protein suz12-A isoform X2 [Ischnura elegans]
MPPKKREKDAETSKNPRMDQMQADHELFLQAFEKPTQIYRFLRTRNMMSPIFLHRTLAYMKGRMSRSHSGRQIFRIDSLLDRALAKQREAARPDRPPSSYMTLTFIGFFDKKVEGPQDPVLVETYLVKICHKKRKDVSSPIMQVCVGTSEVPINPSEDNDQTKASSPQSPTVSIPTDSFSLSNGHLVKSYMLLLRVYLTSNKNASIEGSNSSHNDQDSAGETNPSCLERLSLPLDIEPPPKRRRSSMHVSQQGIQRSGENDVNMGESRLYGAELVVYDRHNRCLLIDGDYELGLQASQMYLPPYNQGQQNGASLRGSNCFNHANGPSHLGPPPPPRASPRKHSSWETVGEHLAEDLGPFESFSRGPTLKFRLKWTPEASNSTVERPRPLRPRPGSEQGLHSTPQPQQSQQSSSAPSSTPNSTPSTDGDKENSRPDSAGGIGCRVSRRKTSSLGNENSNQQQQDGMVVPSSGAMVHQNHHNHNHQIPQQPQLQIVYQFVYNSSNRQQTEACEDLHCPWCSLDCVSLYALLKHLKLCHSRFLFTYVPIPEGARIDVSINEHHDGSYSGGPHDLLSQPPGLAFSRDGPVRRTPVTHILVCRPPRTKTAGSIHGLPHQLGSSHNSQVNSGLHPGTVVNGAYSSSQGFTGGASSIHQRNCSALLPISVPSNHVSNGSSANQGHQTNSQQAVAPYIPTQGGNGGTFPQGCIQDSSVGWGGSGSRPSLAEFLQPEALAEEEFHNHRSYITGHNRLYHHTVTCLPIYPKELDIDSEGENDPKWLRTKTVMMIDDFTDVNEGEKELMKMWNLHVMKNGYVGDCQIPLACTMFVEAHGKELLLRNLYRNFVLHLSSLFDFGLLSPVTIYTTLQKLQDIIGTTPEACRVLHDSWQEQRKHWRKTGKAQAAAAAAAAMASQTNNKSNARSGSPMPGSSLGADDESMTSREPSPVPVAGRTRGGSGVGGSAPQTPASGHASRASGSSQNSGSSFVRTRGGSLGSSNTNGANFTRSRSSGPSWSNHSGTMQGSSLKVARGTPPPPRKSGVGPRGGLDDSESSDRANGRDEGSERGS